eukprot:CAMPEP_0172741734 /NCGR_PEP_ID=MMETSP1074-20121228/127894_1 /TAXON_ID=2916 /ORGANISM="Ceratium fusus, Strain PA161109" /LENGTH=226 /DNA_ID=CAMNT_0013572111 /DNA_START=43 /DNA_END=723 /DNA_ORIENTATION=-
MAATAGNIGSRSGIWKDGSTTRVALGSCTPVTGRPARDPLAAAAAYRIDGSELWKSGDVTGAVARWRCALSAAEDVRGRVPESVLDSLQQPLHANLAQGLLRLERFSDAREEALEALRLQPTCTKARYRLAEAHAGLGAWVEASEALAELEVCGHTAAAACGRTLLRRRQREAKEAEKTLALRMLGCDSAPSLTPPSRKEDNVRIAASDDLALVHDEGAKNLEAMD